MDFSELVPHVHNALIPIICFAIYMVGCREGLPKTDILLVPKTLSCIEIRSGHTDLAEWRKIESSAVFSRHISCGSVFDEILVETEGEQEIFSVTLLVNGYHSENFDKQNLLNLCASFYGARYLSFSAKENESSVRLYKWNNGHRFALLIFKEFLNSKLGVAALMVSNKDIDRSDIGY